MTKTELLVRLRDLHEELSGINIDLEPNEHVDDDTIEALGELVTDVATLVDQAKLAVANEEEVPLDHKGVIDRIVDFDQNHPRVSRFLSQMTDLLAMMGI